MKLSPNINLKKSLNQAFSDQKGATQLISDAQHRQEKTAEAILERFFCASGDDRREMIILADEVGLGKTYVALSVAVSVLDAIRKGQAPAELPVNKPCVLVLTPRNGESLFNKWVVEATKFRAYCSEPKGALGEWLQIITLRKGSSKGNILDLAERIRCNVSKSKPAIIIASTKIFSSAIEQGDSRTRALATVFRKFSHYTANRKHWFHKVFDAGWSDSNLADLRTSDEIWANSDNFSPNLKRNYELALNDKNISEPILEAIKFENGAKFVDALDDLSRAAHLKELPVLPLIIFDEIHNLKNSNTAARRALDKWVAHNTCRLLGLSATPFQLGHEELINVLGVRNLLKIDSVRHEAVDSKISELEELLGTSRYAGKLFRESWRALCREDQAQAYSLWSQLENVPTRDWAKILLVSHSRT